MRSVAVLLAMTLAACSPETEVTGTTNKCVTDLYPSYNSKLLDQCVDVCIEKILVRLSTYGGVRCVG